VVPANNPEVFGFVLPVFAALSLVLVTFLLATVLNKFMIELKRNALQRSGNLPLKLIALFSCL
jgi:hypothetical protein